eukprot:TRINITY_DN990_c0_g1_i1.p1 TRINITY_DN990_c0_g1~~TRINITY_DN990_c0_g1_i1.p1  ORF type:complete len:279 (-),score=73.48 TRINITY_DN990_c0_g1_i1:88-924(-)
MGANWSKPALWSKKQKVAVGVCAGLFVAGGVALAICVFFPPGTPLVVAAAAKLSAAVGSLATAAAAPALAALPGIAAVQASASAVASAATFVAVNTAAANAAAAAAAVATAVVGSGTAAAAATTVVVTASEVVAAAAAYTTAAATATACVAGGVAVVGGVAGGAIAALVAGKDEQIRQQADDMQRLNESVTVTRATLDNYQASRNAAIASRDEAQQRLGTRDNELWAATHCMVCMEFPRTRLAQPCNHLCLCERCAAGLHACPQCRGAIAGLLPVFVP